jgi:hypothetical protein
MSAIEAPSETLRFEGQHTNFAISILDIEHEDTLDLLDLLLTLLRGETLEVLVDLLEESRRLEAGNSDSYD